MGINFFKKLFTVSIILGFVFIVNSVQASAEFSGNPAQIRAQALAYKRKIQELVNILGVEPYTFAGEDFSTPAKSRVAGIHYKNKLKELLKVAEEQGRNIDPKIYMDSRLSSTPSRHSSPIVGTPSVNFSVDDSSLLPRKIDFSEGGLNHGASDYEIVAKKSQIINALKHWVDSSLYTSGGDAGKLLQDYVDQHQPSDDSVDSVWKDVSGIEMRGGFKSRLEEIVEAVPLQTDQNPTEQKLSVIKAVCDWIDEIAPGEDTRDFLKYDPLRTPAGQRIHHFPDARNPDAPTDKSKGAFKMAIRAKILEAF